MAGLYTNRPFEIFACAVEAGTNRPYMLSATQPHSGCQFAPTCRKFWQRVQLVYTKKPLAPRWAELRVNLPQALRSLAIRTSMMANSGSSRVIDIAVISSQPSSL